MLYNNIEQCAVCTMPSRIALRASVTGDTGATNALLGATPLPPFLQLDPDHDDDEEEEDDEVDLDHNHDDHEVSIIVSPSTVMKVMT